MSEKTDTSAEGAKPAPEKATAPKPAPRKGFDPASIHGGKQPGGKVQRGTKSMLPGKSRGR